MDKIVSIAILVGGIMLIAFGVNASNSFSSDVSRMFTDGPTDKAMGLLIGGVVVAIIGLAGLLRSSRS
mgnify:CR=1 FL=1